MQTNERPFDYTKLFIDSRSDKVRYQASHDNFTNIVTWGQRKLLISEIAFFTLFWIPEKVHRPVVVYAGAASGEHIPVLCSLFQFEEVHLYDPAPFGITEEDQKRYNITLHQEYFTDETAAFYSGREDIFFISDIRTVNPRGESKRIFKAHDLDYDNGRKSLEGFTDISEVPQEILNRGRFEILPGMPPKILEKKIQHLREEIRLANKEVHEAVDVSIKEDMNKQANWVRIMNPVQASLKFRLPYPEDPDREEIFDYMEGYLLHQSWARNKSTETRLIPVKSNQEVGGLIVPMYRNVPWARRNYESILFYHNTVERDNPNHIYYIEGELTNKIGPISYPELLTDFDSVAEAFTLLCYLRRAKILKFWDDDARRVVGKLSQTLTTMLNDKLLKSTLGPKKTHTLNELRKRGQEQPRHTHKTRVVKKTVTFAETSEGPGKPVSIRRESTLGKAQVPPSREPRRRRTTSERKSKVNE